MSSGSLVLRARYCGAHLARNTGGASVIETAIVFPVLLTLMAGAVDFAMGFWLKMQTQQAAARSIELATAGGLEALSVTTLQEEAATAAHVPPAQVTVRKWLECNGVVRNFDVGCNGGEIIGRYVSVRIQNAYRPMFAALLPVTLAPNGSISFAGYATLRLQ